jgi:hypothetical protein
VVLSIVRSGALFLLLKETIFLCLLIRYATVTGRHNPLSVINETVEPSLGGIIIAPLLKLPALFEKRQEQWCNCNLASKSSQRVTAYYGGLHYVAAHKKGARCERGPALFAQALPLPLPHRFHCHRIPCRHVTLIDPTRRDASVPLTE